MSTQYICGYGYNTITSVIQVSMGVMTRVDTRVFSIIGDQGEFVRCLHSVGYPLHPGVAEVSPCH